MIKEWYSASELAGLPGSPGTKAGVIHRATKESWKSQPRVGRGGGLEYHLTSLPSETRVGLMQRDIAAEKAGEQVDEPAPAPAVTLSYTAAREYDRDALWDHYGKKKQPAKDKAQQNLKAIQHALAAIAGGMKKRRAWEEAADAFGYDVGTLYRWYGKVLPYHREDWLAALVPGHTGRTGLAECSPEAWDYFKADFLRLEQPAAKACFERLMRVAKERGWQVPCLRTLERKIQREIPLPALIKARQGNDALKALYPAQVRDRTVFSALEAVCADGHKFDVFVKWPDGEIGRPCMVGWQDIFSGKLLSYRVDKTENADTVRLSFGDLVDTFGIPGKDAYLDNGRGFAGKWMTGGTKTRYRFKIKEDEPFGLLPMLGITVHWTTPYHGQAKPIERAWRDLCEYVARHPAFVGAYTGNNPMAKPENYGSKAIPMAEFLAVVEQEVAAHNARQGRRSAVCAGASFDDVFNRSYATTVVRKATSEQRRLWLLAAEGVTVKHDATITLKTDRDNRYWAGDLYEFVGKKVVVRFDPQSLHDLVHVYMLDGRYLCEAKCIQATGFNDTQAAREHNRARKQFQRAARDSLNAELRMDALEAAKMLPGLAPVEVPDAKVVRPFRPAESLRQAAPEANLTEAQQAAIVQFQANFKPDEDTTLTTLRNDIERLSYWKTLRDRVNNGETLGERTMAFYISFGESDFCRRALDMEAEFEAAMAQRG